MCYRRPWRQFILVMFLLLLTGAEAPRLKPGPDHLPHVIPQMQTPGFWLERLGRKDEAFLTPRQYQRSRRSWVKQGLIMDLDTLPSKIPARRLHRWLSEDFRYLKRAGRYYGSRGRKMTAADYKKIIQQVNLSGLKGSRINVLWGLIVRDTSLMLFPTALEITAKPKDVEFNLAAHSRLLLATPVAVVHTSANGRWTYVISSIGRGWVRTDHVAVARQRAGVLGYRRRPLLVLVDARSTVEVQGRRLETTVGCWLARDRNQQALVPVRTGEGKLAWARGELTEPDKWSDHFLPATPGTMVTEAFKLLGQPYGWGGQEGLGDCSEFIRRLGLTCGMIWPRSTTQLRRGFAARKISRPVALQGGQSLLFIPGHVMLVLGTVEGRTYVIHNLYGIYGQDQEGPFIARVAKVVVSDLSLGQGSRKGSLAQRLDAQAELEPVVDKP